MPQLPELIFTTLLSPRWCSAASVYTEMNAISKGVAIGIYDKSKQDGVEASRGGSQPYVDLMGRRYGHAVPIHAGTRH